MSERAAEKRRRARMPSEVYLVDIATPDKQQNMNNLRQQNRQQMNAMVQAANGVAGSESPNHRYMQHQPSPQYNLPRPLSLQRGIGQTPTQEENPQGFCEMLRRHQESKAGQQKRVRRNIPSAQHPRSKMDDLMAAAASEEVMRVKNENAIQRAMNADQNNKKGAYTPSVQALKKLPNEVSENQPPLSSRSRQQKSSIAQRLESEMMERQHNIIKEQALKEIHRII